MSYQILESSSRAEWLMQRKNYIGASDIPALLGESKWRTAGDVIADKTGIGSPFVDNVRTYWGRTSEQSILQGFSELCDLHLTPNNKLMFNPEVEGLAATPDALVDFSKPGPMVLEVPKFEVDKMFHSSYTTFCNARRMGATAVVDAKCVSSKNRSKWSKPVQCPEEYYGQLQAQMLVTGTKVGFLVAKVDAHELYGYAIEADEFYFELIKERVREVWRTINQIRSEQL
jgi:putative phage-type endonuclease